MVNLPLVRDVVRLGALLVLAACALAGRALADLVPVRLVPQVTSTCSSVQQKPLAFSPDGSLLALEQGPSVLLWDVSSSVVVAALTSPRPPGGSFEMEARDQVAFAPSMRMVARVRNPDDCEARSSEEWMACQSQLDAWSLPDGQHIRFSLPPTRERWILGFAASEQVLLTAEGQSGSELALWALPEGKLLLRRHIQSSLVDCDYTREFGPTMTGDIVQVAGSVAVNPRRPEIALIRDDGSVEYWAISPNIRLLRVARLPGPASAIAFLPEGDALIAVCNVSQIVKWDIGTNRVRQRIGSPGGNRPAGVSRDGSVALLPDEKGFTLFELETAQKLGHLPVSAGSDLRVSPNGDAILVGTDDWMELWRTRPSLYLSLRCEPAETWPLLSSDGMAVALSVESRCANEPAAEAGDWKRKSYFSETVIRDTRSGRRLSRTESHVETVLGVGITGDARFLMIRPGDTCVGCIEKVPPPPPPPPSEQGEGTDAIVDNSPEEEPELEYPRDCARGLRAGVLLDGLSGGGTPSSLVFESRVIDARDARWFEKEEEECPTILLRGRAVGMGDGCGTRVDTADGSFVQVKFDEQSLAELCAADPSSAACWLDYRSEGVIDTRTGRLVRSVQTSWSTGDPLFLGDSRTLAVPNGDGTVDLVDVDAGTTIEVLAGHSAPVTSISATDDGRFILTGSHDGSSRLWNATTGQEVCRIYAFRDGSWAIIDPDGRYDASDAGSTGGLVLVAGMEPLSFRQLKERYYEPGLLSKILGFNDDPLRPVRSLKSVALFPQVSLTAPASDSATLELGLTNRGGGIGRVQVLVNGKELESDARGSEVDPDAKHATITVDLSGAAVLAGQENVIEVVAWNAEGYLSSRGVVVPWTPPARQPPVPPRLWAIVVGVSQYASEKLWLDYAATDAADIASALGMGAQRLLGAEKVNLAFLADTRAGHALPPTKTNIAHAFDAARAARPEDILVVYLAGHGVALTGSSGGYAFLTADARSADLSDPAVRTETSITSDELTRWVKSIPALKQVLILDTCAAGAVSEDLLAFRAVPSSQIRAIERLKDRTGVHVLMGSAADARSYEASRYGQGILTYALLEGLRGAALRDDEYADVSRLFEYTADRVPGLARDVGGIQRPLIAAPAGQSFDIGRFTAAERSAIPVAEVLPVVLPPTFLDEGGVDPIGLAFRVAEGLRELAHEEGERRIVYLDVGDFPGALRASGLYTIQGEEMFLRLNVSRNGQTIERTEVRGTRAEIGAFVDQVVEAIARGAWRMR